MGTFINKGNEGFRSAIAGEYIDKTELISFVNKTLGTERRYSCVTRCRRFGKSMAAEMLRAYYDESCDSQKLFDGLKISADPSFGEHLNKYPVIYVDITDFITKYKKAQDTVTRIENDIKADILLAYPDIEPANNDDLMDVLLKVVTSVGKKFIMIIDEWEAICREFSPSTGIMDEYVSMLRRLFKGGDSKDVFEGVYITGILPIKKYKTESALNNFREYSMADPGTLAPYFGFLESEVAFLSDKYGVDLSILKKWYDGYQIGDIPSVFNPYSVMEAVSRNRCKSYWQATGAYDAVKTYIQMNYQGLKDDLIRMLSGERCKVNTTKFQNDLSTVSSKDDVLTVLIHLGYLAYDWNECVCYIPNKEVGDEMTNAVEATDWKRLNDALAASERLLADTLDMNEAAVAKGLELAHDENTSILSYNDENSLACVLSIAYYYAKNDYIIHRELASGKGFADIVLIPRRNVDSPALVIELKFGSTSSPRAGTDTAIDQIHRKNYPAKVAEYVGNLLLVGINYDKVTKAHSCKIERYAE